MVHWLQCSAAEMEEVLDRALTHAEQAGDQRTQSRVLGFLARASVTGPRPVAEGVERCQAILGRAGDDVGLIAVTETMLSVLDAMQGRLPRPPPLAGGPSDIGGGRARASRWRS